MSLGPILQDDRQSVNACQVLRRDRFAYPVLQIKGRAQLHDSHELQATKDQCGINFSARNKPIAMVTFLHAEAVRLNSIPELHIIQGT